MCDFVDRIGIYSNYDRVLVKSMLLLMYQACFRFSEVGNSNGIKHALRRENVRIDSKGDLGVTFTLGSYKNSKGPVTFRMEPAKDMRHCPVKALSEFLVLRDVSQGVMFTRENGRAVSRDWFAAQIKMLVQHLGLDPARFNTHSLRAGRATDLAVAGTPELIIAETGRWNSPAYLRYVRFDVFVLLR